MKQNLAILTVLLALAGCGAGPEAGPAATIKVDGERLSLAEPDKAGFLKLATVEPDQGGLLRLPGR